MRITLFTFLFTLLWQFGWSQSDKIQWYTWDEAMALQEEEPRNLFVDVYTDWCGWCKKMDAGTFTDSNIVYALNNYYYPIKFNAEKGDTIVFNNVPFYLMPTQSKRKIHSFAATLLDNQLSYPSFVVLDKNIQRLMILKGYQQPDALNGVLLFFATDQHVRYIQYLNYEQQRKNPTPPSN